MNTNLSHRAFLSGYQFPLAIVSVVFCVMPAVAGQLAYVPISSAIAPGPGIAVIDTTTQAVTTSIPLDVDPAEMALTPDGQFAYVALPVTTAGQINNTVAVVSTASNSVVATITVGNEPTGVAITPDGSFVYVSNAGFNSVWVIATDTNSVVATVPTGNAPEQLAMSPQGDFVYVTNFRDDSISVISTATNTVSNTIPIGPATVEDSVEFLVLSPDGKRLYAQAPRGIAVIDTATKTVLSTIPLPSNLNGLAITPDGHFLYTITGQGATGFFISVIDTTNSAVVAAIPDPGLIGGGEVTMSPDGTQLYVSNASGGTVTVISTATNTVLESFPTGGNTGAVVFATNGLAPLSSISFNPSNVAGGTSTKGTLILNAAAPAGGASVSLASDTVTVTVPASVVVPAGSKTVDFPVTTSAVSSEYPVTVTAAYQSSTVSAQITLSPAGQVSVSSISVNPVEILGGVTASGTVTLSGPAPSGGVSVELWTNGAPAFVPASVTIAAGSTMASFPVTTNYEPTVMEGTLTAFYNGFSRSAAITVTPQPTLFSISTGSPITSSVRTEGIVTLTEPAPAGGAIVYMWTEQGVAIVPTSVFLPAGQLSVPFTATANAVSAPTPDVIVAFYLGVTATRAITVAP